MIRFGLAVCLPALMLATPARACMPAPLPAPLPTETQEAYRIRVDASQRQQQADWARERQAEALRSADRSSSRATPIGGRPCACRAHGPDGRPHRCRCRG